MHVWDGMKGTVRARARVHVKQQAEMVQERWHEAREGAHEDRHKTAWARQHERDGVG